MTLEKLTEIVRTVDRNEIARQLKKLGYKFCNKDKKLGKVGIVELVRAVKFETEDFADEQRKYLYNGRVCGEVDGYESYEFVCVNVYEIKPSVDPFDEEETALQTEMFIWAKSL